MPYPVWESITATLNTATSTSNAVNMPPTTNSGDLLLLPISMYAEVPSDSSGEWTLLDSVDWGTSAYSWWAKESDGTEASDGTFTFTTGSARRCAAYCIRITGWGGTLATDVDIGIENDATTNDPDPPVVTAGWGSDENLFIVGVFTVHNTTPTRVGDPSGYTHRGSQSTNDFSAGAGLHIWSRELTALSDNPGTISWSGNTQYLSNTVVVKPGVATPPAKNKYQMII